ncbi:hypothetical protein MNKW57_14360 [Biformimicrobium ophioploci]|uniref:DUF937 domain-containing protein n=2 Tax=Biformimicrobium ophioploci TaxID=3036711 RepID=A0ABQ6LYF4_9GAMM|nr:hypothetical protein MNKW57_14360 [Microbulbifer sp. NKW57]
MTRAGETERGAKAFGSALDDASSGGIGDWMSMLTGNSDNLLKMGANVLGSILGGERQTSGLVNVLSQFLGLEKSGMGKLVAACAPMIINVLAGHRRKAGLDNAGMLSLMSSQKSEFDNAMPTGLLSQINKVVQFADRSAENVERAVEQPERRGGIPWWGWAAALAGIGLLFFGSGDRNAPEVADVQPRDEVNQTAVAPEPEVSSEMATSAQPGMQPGERATFNDVMSTASKAAMEAQAGNIEECIEHMHEANKKLSSAMENMDPNELQARTEEVKAFVAKLRSIEAEIESSPEGNPALCHEIATFRSQLQERFGITE